MTHFENLLKECSLLETFLELDVGKSEAMLEYINVGALQDPVLVRLMTL